MTANLTFFALAAVFEIAGCFAFWLWIRRSGAPYLAALGVFFILLVAGFSGSGMTGSGSETGGLTG